MIYLEYHILDPNTWKKIGSYDKQFDTQHEYMKFYKSTKVDIHSLINVMFYDPHKNAGQKLQNDVKLYSMSRGVSI